MTAIAYACSGNQQPGCLRTVIVQTWVLTLHALRANFADKRVVFVKVLQPLVLLLVLGAVFGNIVDSQVLPQSIDYLDYLLPALLVTSGIGTAAASGTVLSRDMERGLMVRLRSLPIAMSSVLIARSLADLARMVIQMKLLVTCAWLFFDFSPHGGVVGVAAAIMLGSVVLWSVIWLFLALACWLRSLDAMQSIAALATFPLMFASTAFVPLEAMPALLRMVASVNPLSYAVEASRGLCFGTAALTNIIPAIMTSIVVAAVGIIAAILGFRRPITELL